MANPYRITVSQTLHDEGLSDITEVGYDSIVPACCSEGCEVEPDGYCSHGCPSLLVAAGII